MRVAPQCNTTWSPRACRGVSKPLALASGQTARQELVSSAAPFNNNTSVQRLIVRERLPQTEKGCPLRLLSLPLRDGGTSQEPDGPELVQTSWRRDTDKDGAARTWLSGRPVRVDTGGRSSSHTCNMTLPSGGGPKTAGCGRARPSTVRHHCFFSPWLIVFV